MLSLASCSGGVAVLGGDIEISDIHVEPDTLDYTGIQGFAAQLFAAAAAADDKNVSISPVSAYIALSMAASGAEGSTARAFSSLLGLEGTELLSVCRAMAETYGGLTGSTVFHVANAAWAAPSVNLRDNFMQNLKDYFSADLYTVDLSSNSFLKSVNQWVNHNTDDMIPEFLKEPLSEESVILLVNVLCMEAKWSEPFQADQTVLRWFQMEDGSKAQVNFLTGEAANRSYFKTDTAEGVILPYDDGRLAFMAFRSVSDRNISGLVSDFTADTLSSYLDSAVKRRVLLSMPVLNLDYSINLNHILKNLGLEIAYDSAKANFSGMADSEGLFISDVLQTVHLAVDEEGTMAAAATSEVSDTSSPTDYIELLFDSPYGWAVIDLKTGVPVFTGIVDNPML